MMILTDDDDIDKNDDNDDGNRTGDGWQWGQRGLGVDEKSEDSEDSDDRKIVVSSDFFLKN